MMIEKQITIVVFSKFCLKQAVQFKYYIQGRSWREGGAGGQ